MCLQNSQVLVVLRLLEDDAQFKYDDHCHAESDWDNELDDLLGSMTKSLKHRREMLFYVGYENVLCRIFHLYIHKKRQTLSTMPVMCMSVHAKD